MQIALFHAYFVDNVENFMFTCTNASNTLTVNGYVSCNINTSDGGFIALPSITFNGRTRSIIISVDVAVDLATATNMIRDLLIACEF
jgi:hypothetical protein